MKKIVWLFSLILCLMTFLISPSASADQPSIVQKEVQEFKVQGGQLVNGYHLTPAQWNLLEGTGERKFSTHINFAEPYQEAPEVVVSISGMDVLNNANNRIIVEPTNVTPTGFDVEYKTWADGKVYSVALNWTAFGGKS